MVTIRLLSLTLLGVATIIIASEYVAETSVTAVIDDPLATIRAPVEGTLPLAKPRLARSVPQGEPLGEIEDSRGAQLHDLERAKTHLTAEPAKTEQSLAMSKKAHANFAASASRYQEGRILQFTVQPDHEQAGLEAANARLVDLNNTFVRANNLSERRIQTVAALDHARPGSSRTWLKDPGPDGLSLRGVSAGEPAFCSTSN